jgi:hypothetical protein
MRCVRGMNIKRFGLHGGYNGLFHCLQNFQVSLVIVVNTRVAHVILHVQFGKKCTFASGFKRHVAGSCAGIVKTVDSGSGYR